MTTAVAGSDPPMEPEFQSVLIAPNGNAEITERDHVAATRIPPFPTAARAPGAPRTGVEHVPAGRSARSRHLYSDEGASRERPAGADDAADHRGCRVHRLEPGPQGARGPPDRPGRR